MLPKDPDFGPFLSLVILLLVLCIVFLALTLPFSAALHSDQGAVAGVIATLTGLVLGVTQLRGRLSGKDRGE